jgi:FkbM family methyltransferase
LERRPIKLHALKKIIDLKIPVATVIDVGVLTGTHDLVAAFPKVPQILIEPIIEWNDTITATYRKHNIDFELLNVAASDANGVMMMETYTVRPGQPITHARLTDKTAGANLREVEVKTLDTIIGERPGLQCPFLLKLDVDGAELKILEGARRVLPNCSVVIIEADVRNFIGRATWLANSGFQLFDLVDICYYDGQLRQFDLVFLNKFLIEEMKIDMYNEPFDISKWKSFH